MIQTVLAWLATSRLGTFLLNFVWGKVASLVGSLFSYLKSLVLDWLEKRRQKKQNEDIQKGESDLDRANEIDDDAERLKAKAEAVCEIERAVNPSSDCGN